MGNFFVGHLERAILREDKYYVEAATGVILLGMAIPIFKKGRVAASEEFIRDEFPEFFS